MTTLVDNNVAGPALHALVVGVGDYPFLPGGAHYVAGGPSDGWGLGQLTSPPVSAQAFLDWLVGEFKRPGVGGSPAAPLGSVEAVISQAGGPASFQGTELERASYPELVTAFNRFYARANAHEDGIAVFYFCGHGVQKGAWSGLVFDDFNSQPLNLNAHVMYYEDFELGMDRCLARQQLFILDACRNTPKAVLQSIGAGQPGQTPIAPGEPVSERNRDYPVYRATSSNQVAFALPGKPSRFTSALLQALRGSACQPLPNGLNWAVQADDVVNSITDLLALEERLYGMPHQEARPSGSSLRWWLHVPDQPKVPVIVGCTPPANLRVVRAGPPEPSRGPQADDWVLELPIADYEVEANFPGGLPQRTKPVLARPPFSEVRL